MNIDKLSKIVSLITGVVSLSSLIANLILGDQGRNKQVIAITLCSIVIATCIYIIANKSKGDHSISKTKNTFQFSQDGVMYR
jgi:hypothetical protein